METSSPPSVDKHRFYALLDNHIDGCPDSSESYLLRAIRDGDVNSLKGMVNRMSNYDRNELVNMDMEGYRLLHVAAHFENWELCKYLVQELKFDVNARGIYGVTPLSCAALFGEESVTRFLLKYGSDPNKQDDSGCTALHNAAQNGNEEVVRLLLSGGARSGIAISHGTPLHIAASYKNVGALKVLLDYSADPNWCSESSSTPLLRALTSARHGLPESRSLDCVKLLVKAGADVNFASPNTPLVVATMCGLTTCIEYLLKVGADANIPDKHHGHMPIQIAASNGNKSLVEILLPFTSRIGAVTEWTVEGIIAQVKSRCTTPKVQKRSITSRSTIESASMRRNIQGVGGAYSKDRETRFYTPQHKKNRISTANSFSSPRCSSGSIITNRISRSAQTGGEKTRSGTMVARKCKRILEYTLSSESSGNSSPPSSRIGTATLGVYGSKFKNKLSKVFQVPYQGARRKMTRRVAKIILRRSFKALTKRYLQKKTLDGCFGSKNFVVDLLDNTVSLQDVEELPYTDSGWRKDRLQFVLMVKKEFFAGEDLPADVNFWLQLIADDKDPWDPRLLGNHIYMLESRLAYGMFMSFCSSSTIHSLRRDKMTEYQALLHSDIFSKYINWNIKFEFSFLNDSMTYKNPDTGAAYDRDIMGLIWLFRCCWQHPAQKYPHIMIAVILGEEIPDFISDVQRALYDFGILQEMA